MTRHFESLLPEYFDNAPIPADASAESKPIACPQNLGPDFASLSEDAFADLYAGSFLCRTARIENTDIDCDLIESDACPDEAVFGCHWPQAVRFRRTRKRFLKARKRALQRHQSPLPRNEARP